MTDNITLQNTQISFTPSFSGNGWETSLVPRLEKKRTYEPEYRITFDRLKKMLLKMHLGGGKEVVSWTAIARMFL